MTEHAQRKQKSNRKSKDLTFFFVNFTYDLEFMMATNIRIYIFDSGLIFYPTYVLCMFTRCVSTNLSYTFYDIHDVPLAEDVLRMSATRIIGIVQPWKGLTNRKLASWDGWVSLPIVDSNLFFFGKTNPRKLTWLAGKSAFWIGDTSSQGRFSIVMFVFEGIGFWNSEEPSQKCSSKKNTKTTDSNQLVTPKLTYPPDNWWLEDDISFFKWLLFRGHSFIFGRLLT